MSINKRRVFGRLFQLVLIVSMPLAIYLGVLVIIIPEDLLAYPMKLILGVILVMYLTVVTIVISAVNEHI